MSDKKKSGRPKRKRAETYIVPQNSRWELPSEEYIFSDEPITVKDLAKKWKASHPTFIGMAKREKWTNKRRAYQLDVERRIAKKEAEKRANETVRFRESLKQRWNIFISQVDTLLVEKDEKGEFAKELSGRLKLKEIKTDQLAQAAKTMKICQEKLSEIIGVDLSKIIDTDEEDKEVNIIFSFGEKDTYRSKI